MIKDNIKVKGTVTAILTDAKTGKVLQTEKTDNVVTNDGFNYVHRYLIVPEDDFIADDVSGAAFIPASIGIGTGTTAVAITDTGLETPTAYRAILTQYSTRAAKSVTFQAEFGIDITGTIKECGVLTRSTGGTGCGLYIDGKSSPAGDGTICTAGAGNEYGPVGAIFAVATGDGGTTQLTKGTGANQWYFADETTRDTIKSVTDFSSGYFVYALLTKFSKTAQGNAKLISHALFANAIAKASTNILRVIWTYTYADA